MFKSTINLNVGVIEIVGIINPVSFNNNYVPKRRWNVLAAVLGTLKKIDFWRVLKWLCQNVYHMQSQKWSVKFQQKSRRKYIRMFKLYAQTIVKEQWIEW